MDSFVLNEIFKVNPEQLFSAWMDSKSHSEMTGGGNAIIENFVNGKFTVWDDYIFGNTIELIPNKKIVQKWRTTEFPVDAPDSIIELILEEDKKGTKLILSHKDIPEGQGDSYKQGWIDYYFEPMKKYFKGLEKSA
jgi:activator of HSP90 ATPase